MPRFTDASIGKGTVLSSQNALLASTLPKLSSDIADQVFTDLPFFFFLKNKNKVKPWDSGESLEVPLMYKKNQYAAAYDDYELMDAGPPSGFGNAVYMRAKYRVPIMYSATTLSANSGRAQIYNLIDKLKMQATKSLEAVINDDLMRQDGTNDTDSKRITGLNYIIECNTKGDGSQNNTVGGILKSTLSSDDYWWDNQYKDISTSISDADGVLSALRENVVACTDGNDSPDLGLCDSTSYLEIESEAFSKRRFVNADMADAGFANVVYNGCTYTYDKNINDWVTGDSVGDGYTFHINSDHLYIAVCTDRNFQVIPPQYDLNQDCYLGAVITHMQLISDKNSALGVVKGTCEPK